MKRTSILPLSFLALVCCGSSAHGADCSIRYPQELVQVDDEPGTCEILLSNGVWCGYLNGTLSVGHCPQEYCYYNKSARIRISTSDLNTELNNMICSPMNRTGVLCGECVPGYGPAMNTISYPCISCTDVDKTRNWVYYILAIYVPIVVMFLLILLCDVRLTTGAFNAFILFGQVISATAFLSRFAQPTSIVTTRLQDAYLIPYSVLNLNIIGNILPSFCLSSDLNSLDVISLKLLEASTPLITIIVIIVVMKFQVRLKCKMSYARQLCRKRINFVHAFDAFIVLSYSRFCDVVSTLVDPGHVWGVNGTVVSVRVYENGEYEYYSKAFLPYKAVGFTVTAILCVIPLLLLQYPLQWLEYMCAKRKKTWYPSVLICTILDVFQGCYKDNRRYFAGLYLILRLLLNFTPLLTIKPDQYLMQQTTLVVFIMLLAILKPYKIKMYNYIDIMILINLLLIGLTNGYQLALYEGDMEPSILVFAFQQVLIWLPLACYVLYGTWKAMTILRTSGWYINCYNWFKSLHQKKDTSVPPINEPITDDAFETMFLRDADKFKRNANVPKVL